MVCTGSFALSISCVLALDLMLYVSFCDYQIEPDADARLCCMRA